MPTRSETATQVELCEWFALCANEATHTLSHPVLGDVPICKRCLGIAHPGWDQEGEGQ